MDDAALDPLLSDDLAVLLPLFPEEALRGLLNGMGARTPIFPYPDGRADAAHAVAKDGELRPHAAAIAGEVRWWASNSLHLAVGASAPTWSQIVRDMALRARADLTGIAADAPAWRIEHALLAQLAAKWKGMTAKEREEAMAQPGVGVNAALGAAVATGGSVMLIGEGVVAALVGRAAPAAVAVVPTAAALAPFVAVAGAAWMLYGFAGPAFRVLGPATALIASTRQALRDQRISDAFVRD